MRSQSTAVLSLLLLAWPCLAVPDFSTSTIKPRSETPLTASVAVFDLHLRNTGNEGGTPVYLEIDWGGAGFFIDIDGLDNMEIDQDRGTVTCYLQLPPGTVKHMVLRVFTFNEARGGALPVRLRMADFNHQTEHWDHCAITPESRPDPVLMRIGPIGINQAALVLLLWLGAIPLVLLFLSAVLKRNGHAADKIRGKAAAITFLWMMPIGFWLIFGAMAWKDWQILTRWTETRGTIVGRHMEVTTSNNASQQAKRQGTDQNYSITLALRFDHQGKTVFGSGYDPDSFLQIGGRKQREKEIREWTVGASIPCWYNPENPTELVVKRGFGGAYFFALLPLPFFLFGVRMLRRR
jgi:hypothetical protein